MDSILLFNRSVIMVLTVCYFLSKLKDIKIKFSIKNLIYIVLLSFAVFYSYTAVNEVIRATILIMVYISINYFILKFKLQNSIANALLLVSLLLVIDLIIGIILTVLEINYNNYLNSHSSLLAIVFNYGTLLFMIILVNIKSTREKMKRLSKMISEILVNKIFIIFEIIVLILISGIIYETISLSDNIIYFTMLSILYGTFILIIQFQYVLFEKHKDKKVQLTNLNKKYLKKIEEDQIYRHNIRNKLLAIKSISDKNVTKLIDNIICDEFIQYQNSVHFGNIPENMLTIFYDKLYKHEQIRIIVVNALDSDLIKELGIIKFSKLIECIGICLDNVIEANINTKDPYINIIFKENENHIIISIRNNFNHNLDIDMLGEKDYSVKKKASGIGLFSLKKIKEINHDISIINDEFKIRFTINKKPL